MDVHSYLDPQTLVNLPGWALSKQSVLVYLHGYFVPDDHDPVSRRHHYRYVCMCVFMCVYVCLCVFVRLYEKA